MDRYTIQFALITTADIRVVYIVGAACGGLRHRPAWLVAAALHFVEGVLGAVSLYAIAHH